MRQLFRSVSSVPASNYQLGGGVGLVVDGALPEAAWRAPLLTVTRRVLLTLMGLGVISAIVGGSMQSTRSSFTASAVNPGNTFASGTLTMTNSNDTTNCTRVVASACGTVTFSTGRLQPGAVYQQTVTITNSGTLPSTMSLQLQNISDSPANTLKAFVNLTIHDDTKNVCLYGTSTTACDPLTNAATIITADKLTGATGVLSLVGSTRADLRWIPGESHQVTFSIEIETTDCSGFSPTPGPAPNPTPAVVPTPSICDGKSASFDMVWSGVQ